jgi:predicted house-cleaning noncanonical NTP pyrophosphatase (MazG superfamily)
MKEYNKLVRDEIPHIIEQNGGKASFHILSDEAYLKELDKKLIEEVNEYHQDKNLEEIVDILEVLKAICIAKGYSIEEVETKQKEKAAARGSFHNKVFLEYVEEN